MLFKRLENIDEIGVRGLQVFSTEEDTYYLAYANWTYYNFSYCEVLGNKMILYRFRERTKVNAMIEVYAI